MAEEKKKGFYQFSITRNSEKIEKLKAKIPFAHLLQTFEVNEDEDEDAIVAKMNNAIAAIMNASEVRTDGGNIKEKNEKLSNLPQGLKEVYLKEVALTDADKDKYEEKIKVLEECYKQAAVLTGYCFYLPIQNGSTWDITKIEKDGDISKVTRNLSLDTVLNAIK